ncbi:MAG TPA: hypothetical protein VF644_08760, partial [Pyrinomonadaceae bacterium]
MADDNKEENKTQEAQPDASRKQEVRISFRIPTRLPSVIAHHLTVQPSEDGVLLSFYEVIPPLIRNNTSDDEIKKIRDIGVTAECVSKVFVPGSRYEGFVEAMESILLPK